MTSNKIQKQKDVFPAYLKYTFISCLKRPYSYIGGIIHLIFLATDLLIVPTAMHSSPMFIWCSPAYNTAVFNLIFIAITCATLSLAVFKRGNDDGFDLSTSAKPISKTKTTLAKIIVYFVFMLVFTASAIGVASLTAIFGEYSTNNLSGITPNDYTALLLSILIGSLINILVFTSISTLISLKGTAVTSMVVTIGLALVLSILNLVIPRFMPTPNNKLKNDYGLSVKTFSANTASQLFEEGETLAKEFVAIECFEGIDRFDTYEYWNKATNHNLYKAINYLDFGKQLSMPFEAFGLQDEQTDSAGRKQFGSFLSYDYQIQKETNISLPNVVDAKQYPIGCYLIEESEGRYIPSITFVGHKLATAFSENWELLSNKAGFDFYAINFASIDDVELMPTPLLYKKLSNKICSRMSELKSTKKQKNAALGMYNVAINLYKQSGDFELSSQQAIISDESNQYFTKGQWNQLSTIEKFNIVSKIQLYWVYVAQQNQSAHILNFDKNNKYPFTSKQITNWYEKNAQNESQPYFYEQQFAQNLLTKGLLVDKFTQQTKAYSLISTETINCETYSNLYQYKVNQFFDMTIISTVYGALGIMLFVCSMILYNKRDIK